MRTDSFLKQNINNDLKEKCSPSGVERSNKIIRNWQWRFFRSLVIKGKRLLGVKFKLNYKIEEF